MTTLLEKIRDLNDRVLQGKTREAFDKYYHDIVIMQENENAPTVGKKQPQKRRKFSLFYYRIQSCKTL